MKNLLLRLGLCTFILVGGVVYADLDCSQYPEGSQAYQECQDDAQGRNFVEGVTVDVADALREVEEFNLRMQYYLRPYEESDLSFNQWRELYGYGTSGVGVIPHGEFKLPAPEKFGSLGANTSMRAFILNVLNWFLSFLGLIAIAVIIYAGFMYIVGGEENNEKSKKMILYAAIGILIILSSYALVNTLITKTLEGGDNFAAINKVSINGVVTNATIDAECITPTGASCAHDLGIGGWAVDAYHDVTFKVANFPNSLKNAKWNFGDGGLYTSTQTDGSVERSFADSRWYNVAVMGQFEDDDGLREFVGQARVWVGDIAKAQFKMSPPEKPKAGQSVEFDASSSSVISGGIDDYVWSCSPAAMCADFNTQSVDPSSSKGKKNFFVTFNTPGPVTVSLIVKAKMAGGGAVVDSASEEKTFNVISAATNSGGYGSINFTIPSMIKEGAPVQLRATGAPSDGAYSWQFANGTTDAGDRVLHTFMTAGVEAVELTADDALGNQIGGIVSKNVIVTSQNKPTAVATLDGVSVLSGSITTVPRGTPMVFGTDSCDEFGACGASAAVAHSWKWNGNPIPVGQLPQILTQLGTHAITLVATSSADSTKVGEQAFRLKVENQIPVVTLTVTDSALGSGFYQIDATANDPDGTIVRYRVEVLEFGTAIETQMISTTQNNFVTIVDLSSKVGMHDYLFRVEATDSDGGKGEAVELKTVQIDGSAIQNAAPTGSIFTTPSTSGTTNTNFRFFTQAEDPDGDHLTYSWTFPDGGTGFGKSAVRRFTTAGTHTVQLSLSDGKETITDSETVTVTAALGGTEGVNRAPQVQISGVSPGNTGDTSTKFSLFSNASDPDGDALTYEWDFSDGSDSTMKNVTHVFSDPGTYQVRLKVSDGLLSREARISLRVVAEGEPIPESDIPPYEPKFHAAPLTPDKVVILVGNKKEEGAGEGEDFLVKGNTNTTFFLYGQINFETDRPIWIEWETGDGRRFSGQDVAWKYPKIGLYSVTMIVSDGTAEVTDTIKIKVE